MRISHFILAAALSLHLNAFCDDAKTAAPQQQNAEAAQKAGGAAKEDSSDLLDAIALLRPSSVVLKVGDKKVEWSEMLPSVKWILKGISAEKIDRKEGEKRIRELFQGIASRGLLLCEAEAMGITVSDDERREYEADLEKNLEGNDKGMTKEKFIASFGKDPNSIVKLMYENALKLIKLDKLKFGNIQITDQELDFFIRYKKAMNEQFEERNAETRNNLNILLKHDQIRTDDGFMEIAKRFSEGKESDDGGILNYDFTREELAEVNELKSFDWKVGETTPLLETKTDFRIMRILAALPRDNENEPEKFRVAQILHGKLPLADVNDKQALLDEMLPKKKKFVIDAFVQSLADKYKASSPLFPNGIWDKKAETATKDAPKTPQNPENNEKK